MKSHYLVAFNILVVQIPILYSVNGPCLHLYFPKDTNFIQSSLSIPKVKQINPGLTWCLQ